MTLFPERLRQSSRELVAGSSRLTDEQKQQLGLATKKYLRDHKLVGLQNAKAVAPVVLECVMDGIGIVTSNKRRNILPTDNLDTAFKEGYRERNALIETAKFELRYQLDQGQKDKSQSAIALPSDLAKKGLNEFRRKEYIPDLKNLKKIAELSRIRRPIFEKLVKFSRDKVEQIIPGSSDVSLSDFILFFSM